MQNFFHSAVGVYLTLKSRVGLVGFSINEVDFLNYYFFGKYQNLGEPHQFSSDDVGGVLESLKRAKMSLREKLSRASPPRQDMLALPAPEDHYTEDDLQVNNTELSLCISQRLSQEILALPTSGDYLSRISLQGDDAKVPVGPAGLFRLPTDSFPQNQVCSTDGYDSKFSLTSSRQTIFSRNPASHMVSTSSFPQYGSGFSLNPYYDHHS